MLNHKPTFRFKQFGLSDRRCGMKIGTDGVLLGAWARLAVPSGRVADIGAGSGLIALMMAQRYPQADITAVEIDCDACADAADNFAASPFAERILLRNESFAAHSGRYDLVVSNPPFFTTGELSPERARAAARHGGELSPSGLIERAHDMLAPGGRLAMITPADMADDIIYRAALVRIYPRRICAVTTRAGKDAVRILWEMGAEDGPCEQTSLTLRDADNHPTPEYELLTGDFYLNIH